MNFSITNSTDWNYIKPMFFGITFVMMILNGLSGAINAFERRCRRQFLSMNSCANGATSFDFFRITLFLVLITQRAILFSLIAVFILILTNFEPFCFGVFFAPFSSGFFTFYGVAIIFTFYLIAIFTKPRKPIFSRAIFVKFRQWFRLLTTRAGFHITNYTLKLGICQ